MACERVQFSKTTHGDGAGIVRKLDANRKRIPATCASSGRAAKPDRSALAAKYGSAEQYPSRLHQQRALQLEVGTAARPLVQGSCRPSAAAGRSLNLVTK